MGFSSEAVDPSLSRWHLMGAALRHWRVDVGKLSLAALAAKMTYDASNLAKWERGERPPPIDAIRRIDPIVGAGGFLVALRKALDQAADVPPEWDIRHSEDMDMVRRQLLTALTLGGGAAALPVDALERLRHVLDGALGPARLEDWEEIAYEYAYALRTRPLAEFIPDLALEVATLRRLPRDDHHGWARVDAQMTFLLAYGLGLSGQMRESRHWWITARRAAEHSGDPTLVAAVRGYEAVQGLYEERSSEAVIVRSDDAIASAQGAPCTGTAEALAAKAQALAKLGDERGARAALDEQARVYEQLPERVSSQVSPFGWPATRHLHTRSYVATYGGYPDAAQAQREALEAYPQSFVRPRAQVRLHEALSLVRSGNLIDGLDLARDVLASLPEHHQTRFVRHTAETVVATVPARLPPKERGVVRNYREALALPPSTEDA